MQPGNLKRFAVHSFARLAATALGLAVQIGKRCIEQLVAARVCDGVIVLQWYAVCALTQGGVTLLRLAARIAVLGM
jgi:hypothetical protein